MKAQSVWRFVECIDIEEFLKSVRRNNVDPSACTKERNINDKYSHMQKSLTESPEITGSFRIAEADVHSGYLDQGSSVSLSPREYWVRGLETRFSQGFGLGDTWHEVGIGYRYINEAGHELRQRDNTSLNLLPRTDSRNDCDTRGSTKAHAFFIDDRVPPRHSLRDD